MEATSRVDMQHVLGPKSHVSLATLVRFLLAMTMETWDCVCVPFRPIFAVFAILAHFANTISPWVKGTSQEGVAAFVAYDQGSIVLEVPTCSSGLARVIQLTVHATCPYSSFLAVFCPVA